MTESKVRQHSQDDTISRELELRESTEEEAVTNAERARELTMRWGNPSEKLASMIRAFETALDAAERRGAERMRERASCVIEHYYNGDETVADEAAAAIRALPLEEPGLSKAELADADWAGKP